MKYIFIQGPFSNAMLDYRSVALVLKIETRFSRIRNSEGQVILFGNQSSRKDY